MSISDRLPRALRGVVLDLCTLQHELQDARLFSKARARDTGTSSVQKHLAKALPVDVAGDNLGGGMGSSVLLSYLPGTAGGAPSLCHRS